MTKNGGFEVERVRARGDLIFLHGLQQRGLGLGGVRLISSARTMLAKIGPWHEPEDSLPGRDVFLDDLGTGDVAGHEVGRELDAAELQVQRPGHGGDRQGLGQAGNADRQAVAAGEEADQHFLDHLLLADDHLVDLAAEQLARLVARGARPLRGSSWSRQTALAWTSHGSRSGSPPLRPVRSDRACLEATAQSPRAIKTIVSDLHRGSNCVPRPGPAFERMLPCDGRAAAFVEAPGASWLVERLMRWVGVAHVRFTMSKITAEARGTLTKVDTRAFPWTRTCIL